MFKENKRQNNTKPLGFQLFVQRVLRSRLTSNLQKRALSLMCRRQRKICLRVLKLLTSCKNAVVSIYRYLKRFYTYKKINSIFVKFDHSLLWMPKIISVKSCLPKNPIQKHNQRANKSVRATLSSSNVFGTSEGISATFGSPFGKSSKIFGSRLSTGRFRKSRS